MIPEPLCFTADYDGYYHLSLDAPPLRTVIDVHSLARLIGVKVDVGHEKVTVECDGRTLVYERDGMTINGHWVCNLRIGNSDAPG